MKERVEIIKKLYPNYLILVKSQDKLKLIGIDKLIADTFGLENVNKLILDNLDIINIQEYDNNLYELYYLKIRLIELINEIRKELIRWKKEF